MENDVTISHDRYMELTQAEKRLTIERNAAVGKWNATVKSFRRLLPGLEFDENDPESLSSAMYGALFISLDDAKDSLDKAYIELFGESKSMSK